MARTLVIGMLGALLTLSVQAAQEGQSTIRVKELVRIDGARDNPLVGYGLVVGLAGTGDSARSRGTVQSVANALSRFGVQVDSRQLAARNVAAVMVTASLRAFANAGDKIDVNVASVGDARSLAGGTLVLTPLAGADDEVHALAQGPVSVGGYRYDAFGNQVQRNHPTVGMIASGATIEVTAVSRVVTQSGALHLILNMPDYTTAGRIADALSEEFGASRKGRDIIAEGPDRVIFRMSPEERHRYVDVVRRIENVGVIPDLAARVVVNERTGTVVSGGDVRIGAVTVTQGDLRITVDTDFVVSQPSLLVRPGEGVRTVVVPDTKLEVSDPEAQTVALEAGTTVAELALALNRIKATPREIISILQAIQSAGALHAQLVVQ